MLSAEYQQKAVVCMCIHHLADAPQCCLLSTCRGQYIPSIITVLSWCLQFWTLVFNLNWLVLRAYLLTAPKERGLLLKHLQCLVWNGMIITQTLGMRKKPPVITRVQKTLTLWIIPTVIVLFHSLSRILSPCQVTPLSLSMQILIPQGLYSPGFECTWGSGQYVLGTCLCQTGRY